MKNLTAFNFGIFGTIALLALAALSQGCVVSEASEPADYETSPQCLTTHDGYGLATVDLPAGTCIRIYPNSEQYPLAAIYGEECGELHTITDCRAIVSTGARLYMSNAIVDYSSPVEARGCVCP